MEEFNKMICQIMDALIESCPVPLEINGASFGLQEGVWNGMHYSLSSEESVLFSTLKWLTAEGFIRGDGEYVITYKGLAHHNLLPNRLQP